MSWIVKKLFVLILLLFIISFSKTQVYAAGEGDYKFYESFGEIAITGYTGTSTDITIPNQINGKPVTSIEFSAFKGKQLTSVTIPDSVTEISAEAFSNNNLTSVIIPDNVTSIGTSAFSYNQLTSVVIPDSVTTIDNHAFRNNQLTTVTIPDGVTVIGEQSFSENQLVTVTIPNSVTNIERLAFYKNKLTNVSIPNSVTSIGSSAFSNNQLTTVTIPDGVTSIETSAFGENQLTTVTIPDSVTNIGNYAFYFNQLTSVTIPDNVTNIGDSAFYGNKLESLTIPDNVKNIGDSAFYKNRLQSIILGNGIESIPSNAFRDNQLTSLTIPDSVFTIGDSAFNNNKIQNLSMGNGIKTIGNSAFYRNQLTTFSIPASVEKIDNSAFSYNQLMNVTIPGNVKSIGDSSFYQNLLTNVIIENGVESIGINAFTTNQITKLDIPNSVISIGKQAFTDNIIEELTLGNSVTTIGDMAFYSNKLTTLIIPNSVTSIGSSAFMLNQLESVMIPNSVTNIGSGAFYGNKLTDVVIPDSITKIENGVFASNELTSVTIPDSVTQIGNTAFQANKLTNVIIPGSVTSIGKSAFQSNQITTLTLPKYFSVLEDYTFSDNRLTNVTIPDNVTKLGNSAFRNNQLTNVVIPEGVKEIGELAFYYNQLTSVSIPKSVTSIGNQAFEFNKSPFAINGYDPSAAKTYAENNNYTFIKMNYNVFYDGNGSTTGNVPIDSTDYLPQEKFIVLPNGSLVKPGYTFIGWNSQADGKGENYSIGSEEILEGDITLYAQWELNNFKVKFETSGGTTLPEETVNYGIKIQEPTLPTKQGHSLVGWYTDLDFTNVWDFEEDTIESDLTLYAKWEVNKQIVSFETSGGTTIPDETVEFGTKLKEPLPSIKQGHSLVGWYTDSGFTKAWDFDVDWIENDLTLYAKWELNKHKVSFETSGGTTIPEQTVDFGAKLKEPTKPTKSRYSFAGWYSDTNYTFSWDFAAHTVTEDLILYAKWNHNGGGGSRTPEAPTEQTPTLQAPDHIKTVVKSGKITIQKQNETTGEWEQASIEKVQTIGGYYIIQLGEHGDKIQEIELPQNDMNITIIDNEESYIYFEPSINISINKEWKVNFSKPLLNEEGNLENIIIQDATGNKIDTQISLSEDGKTVIVTPAKPYEKGQLYYMTVSDIVTESGILLKNPVRKIFIVE